jgi:protein-disulfide isomerase
MRGALLIAALVGSAAAAPLAAAPVHHRAPVHRGAAAHPAARPGARDWSQTVVATPEGGFRMGNPAARVKLVEYGSLTCPHCRHFAETGVRPLVQNYVRTGKVSYEFRNFILNGIDVAATLLARCSGPNFFRASDAIYAAQPQWLGKVTAMSAADRQKLQSLPDAQRLVRIGAVSGLTPMVARFGVPAARANLCLQSKPAMARLGAIAEAANKMGVNQTPTFILNGAKTDAASWEELEPLVRKAAG